MKVLVVGSGAREHALVWKCVQSELVDRVYCAPGNGGTGGMARNVGIGAADVVSLVKFSKRERLGRSGKKIVVEERLEGPELSVLAVTDGTEVIPLAPARDYKRALEGDRGANTGGMGAYSPPKGVDDALVKEVVDCVMRPAVQELAGSGDEFRGVLYAGLMLTGQGVRALEFNARFGDPEAQVVLPRLESDFVAMALAAAKGSLAAHPDLRWSPRACVGVVVASGHYPDDVAMTLGHRIGGLTGMPPGALIFHAGTRYEPGIGLVTDGGRVVTSVALGETVAQARDVALAGARQVRFEGAFFRSDIAQEAE